MHRELEEPGIIVDPNLFHNHMRWLRELGTIVKLSDWLTDPESYKKERCFAVTCDDGWWDNYEYAFPVVCEERVPISIFLVTSFIDTARRFWPGEVYRYLDGRETKLTEGVKSIVDAHIQTARRLPSEDNYSAKIRI
ncbi:MAG: polysaccharide deacetylase family protein [Pseudomonadales bacterium]|nr:polysaccharide deacetylase family protein [Pseudomonadales bacterium]